MINVAAGNPDVLRQLARRDFFNPLFDKETDGSVKNFSP
ncbi:hypothetical protein SRABI106_04391 [Rahnella aquatilis]|nr:hypothetical protein SRABI106_04391 [Rahnella aquatilis]